MESLPRLLWITGDHYKLLWDYSRLSEPIGPHVGSKDPFGRLLGNIGLSGKLRAVHKDQGGLLGLNGPLMYRYLGRILRDPLLGS